jgi:hypothetical protein
MKVFHSYFQVKNIIFIAFRQKVVYSKHMDFWHELVCSMYNSAFWKVCPSHKFSPNDGQICHDP